MSQAALFSVAAAGLGGWEYSLLMGGTFMLGMMLTDGLNGLWISRLIQRSNQMACLASRVMSLSIASLSLLVAAFGTAKYFSPAVDAWSEGRELMLGFAVIAVVAGSFLFALRLSRRAPLAADA